MPLLYLVQHFQSVPFSLGLKVIRFRFHGPLRPSKKRYISTLHNPDILILRRQLPPLALTVPRLRPKMRVAEIYFLLLRLSPEDFLSDWNLHRKTVSEELALLHQFLGFKNSKEPARSAL